ncbi:MAG TPA: hypothetical protein VFR13_10240 [Jiangellaceae bacterium]|nr:hypothetical protein [Jiangellaceae bacterium]
MLLEDFLVAQTAGAVAVSWVDGSPDTGRLPPLDGVDVRHDVADGLPVFLVRRDEIDQLTGRLGRRPEQSRAVVLTDVFLFEPAAHDDRRSVEPPSQLSACSGRTRPGSAGVRRPMASRASRLPGTGLMAGPMSCGAAASPRPHAGWRL